MYNVYFLDKVCIPDCLNNGDCVHGQCRCKSGFEGDYCQIGNKSYQVPYQPLSCWNQK